MQAKEEFLSNIEVKLNEQYGKEQSDDIMNILVVNLEKYDMSVGERGLVAYDNSDQELIARFFVAKKAQGLSPRTLTYYKIVLQKFYGRVKKHIKDITSDDIRLYIAWLAMNGCSTTTQNNERRALSSFFGYLFNEELIPTNPCVKVKKIHEFKKIKKALTESELELLRSGAKSLRDKCIIEFLFSTGCRVSELVSINRDDLDMQSGELIVLGKGSKYRKVFLSPRCLIILQQYLKLRKDKNPALFVSYVKVNNRGLDIEYNEATGAIQRMSTSGIESMVRLLGQRLGIENVHPHRIRRTVATLALRRGMPIDQVRLMLGHEKLETTTLYATTDIDAVRDSHSKFVI